MFEFVRRRLSRKILIALALSAAVFMTTIIYFVVEHQTDSMIREIQSASEDIEHAIYAGIIYPMTIGDKESVERELLEIKKTSEHMDVFICDTEQNIIYSSQINAINSKISSYVSNKTFLKTLNGLLKTGHDPAMAFEDETGNTRYILTSYPLLNHQECNRCHGSLKKVLGSMVVKMNAEEDYASIADLRNYNIIISIIGIMSLTILMYVILSRLVKQPLVSFNVKIDELTAKIPEGDYSTRIDIKRQDEIGTLINSFNHMAETLDGKNIALQKAHIELADANEELQLAKEGLEEMNETLAYQVEKRTKELRKSEEQARAFALRLAEAEEQERKRLSQELHDEVGQQLSVLGINLNLILSQTTTELPEIVRSRITDSINLVEQATEKTRNIMANLRPPVLDDYGLAAALKWYAGMFFSRTGIMVDVEAADIVPRPSPSIENALFRIVQEALTNTAKHSTATQASLSIRLDRTTLRLEIADNGMGFDPELQREQNKWGLINIREHAEAIGGMLHIDTSQGNGTRVIIIVEV